MGATVLIYGFEGAELKKLKGICSGKSVRAKAVKREDYGRSIGAMCAGGGKDLHTDKGGVLRERMLVLANFSSRQMDAFLAEMRTARVGTGALKAVLTPYNASWDAYMLCEELMKERDGIG